MENNLKFLIFLLTYDCNLRCSYCYEPKKAHKSMTIESAKTIIQKALNDVDDSFGSIEIQFMGGEPLLEFDIIKEVCEWLWSTKHKIEITHISSPTNGTLLNDNMRRWLVKNRERFQLLLSFDGTRLMQNMNRSKSANSIDLDFFSKTYPHSTVKMTMSPATVGQLYNGIKFLYDKGFRDVDASLALGNNIGWNKEHLKLLSTELDKLIDFYTKHTDIKPIALFNMPVWMILNSQSEPFVCYCGKNISCYDCNGEKYPCHIMSPIALSEDKAKVVKVINFDTIRKKRSKICKSCLLVNVCSTCYGINYRDRGNFNQPSPFVCAQFKLFFYASCMLQKRLAIINSDAKGEKLIDRTIQLLITKVSHTLNST